MKTTYTLPPLKRMTPDQNAEIKTGWEQMQELLGADRAILYLAYINERVHKAGIHSREQRHNVLRAILRRWS